MTGPLQGIRILDLSRVLAGPWATQLLGDMGAEIVKIERPGSGDDTRGWGPPFVQPEEGPDADGPNANRERADPLSAYFLGANRNKRSVCLDFSDPEDARKVRALAATADVVVENFKTGGLARYGLDYASLAADRPDLVYCSITGFGQTGPLADRPGYDLLIQAMSGLMSITGRPDGEAGAGPVKVGVALVDIVTGLYAANGIQAALRHRDRTGAGQHVGVALLDTMTAALANQALSYLVSGIAPGRMGNAHPSIAPYDVFPTRDRDIVLAIGNDDQFARLCTVLGVSELARDHRFATNRERVRHRDTLRPLLVAALAAREGRDWLADLARARLPSGPVNTIADLFAEPQIRDRGRRLTLPSPRHGPLPSVACPLEFSATPVTYRAPPPELGQDTQAVLAGLARDDKAPPPIERERLHALYGGKLLPGAQIAALRDLRHAFPTRTVRRAGAARPLPVSPEPLPEIRFTSRGTACDLCDYISRNRNVGLLILKDGAIRFENHEFGHDRQSKWPSMAMTKSVTSTLVGAALHRGEIGGLEDPLTDYLPVLAGSAYAGVTIRHLLQMTSGVAWSEDYGDPKSDRRRMLDLHCDQEPGAILRYMATRPRVAAPGAVWNDNSGDAHIAGALVRAATGRFLADDLSETLWGPLGMDRDAEWWLESPGGLEVAGGGLFATLRDYARFGLLMAHDGVVDGQRLLPEGWAAQAGGRAVPAPGRGHYGHMWWPVADADGGHADGAFRAGGVFGQDIYVNPARQVVICVWSARSKATGADAIADDDFFNAVAAAL